jgi:O-antigen ligase
MVLMSSIMAIHALMQQKLGYGFAGQPPILQWRPALQRNVVRSWFFGIFSDPNDLAQILSASIPFAFVLTRRFSFFSFLLGFGFSVLLVAGIFATYSRGGLVGLIVAVILMTARFLPPRLFATCSVLTLLIALMVIPYSKPYLDESAHDRVVFWGEANWAFKENPIFGVGYGMLEEEYVGGERSVHNAFVWCYASLGIVGYWFWYGLLQLSMIGAWRTMGVTRYSPDEEVKWLRRYAGLAMAALGSFAVSSYFLSRAFIFPLFFLIGMVGVIPYIGEKLLCPGRPLIRPVRDVLIYGTLGMLFSIVYIYLSIVILNNVFYG